MYLRGRTFSAVLYGAIEIVALPCETPGRNQIAIKTEGGSFIMDGQIIEAESPAFLLRQRIFGEKS